MDLMVHLVALNLANRGQLQIWEDSTSHHYDTNATDQLIWNRFVDWILDYSRIDYLLENSDWEEIPKFNMTDVFVCHLGRVGHLSSILRSGPAYISEFGDGTALKVPLTLRHLEFKFSNCTFWPKYGCPSWNGSKIDFFKPSGIFSSNSIYLEISWNLTEILDPNCSPVVNVSSVVLREMKMKNLTPLVHDCISDEFRHWIVQEIYDSIARIIKDKLNSIIKHIITNIVDFGSLYLKFGHVSPFWTENMFRGLGFSF